MLQNVNNAQLAVDKSKNMLYNIIRRKAIYYSSLINSKRLFAKGKAAATVMAPELGEKGEELAMCIHRQGTRSAIFSGIGGVLLPL